MKMLRKTVDVSLLGDSLSELLTEIQNQVEVTLTCDGIPLAKVLPLSPEEKVTINEKGLPTRIPGGWKGRIVIADDFNDESPEINAMFYGEEE